jgi:hypothetical protein
MRKVIRGNIFNGKDLEALKAKKALEAQKAKQTVYKVNLARVPKFAHASILAQIARDEGIAVTDIIVEGVTA